MWAVIRFAVQAADSVRMRNHQEHLRVGGCQCNSKSTSRALVTLLASTSQARTGPARYLSAESFHMRLLYALCEDSGLCAAYSLNPQI